MDDYTFVNMNESEETDVFELELPNELKDSKVVVETENNKYSKLFSGYLLNFKIKN
jgi:hypothetical protein